MKFKAEYFFPGGSEQEPWTAFDWIGWFLTTCAIAAIGLSLLVYFGI